MKKYEAYYNTMLCNYFREKKVYCYYELKQTGNQDTFNFAKIEKVQWDGLQATEKNGLVWKLSDEISRPKPCDGFSIPPLPSYLVIKFNNEFCLIRFGEIVKLRDEGVISITKKKAEEISEKIIKM
jgi:hypothetical protein